MQRDRAISRPIRHSALRRVCAGLLLYAAVLVGLYVGVFCVFRIPRVQGVDHAAIEQLIDSVRTLLRGETHRAAAGRGPARLPGPVWVSIHHSGRILERHRSELDNVDRIAQSVARALAESAAVGRLSQKQLSEARIKVDVLVAQAPVLDRIPALFSMSLVPGRDGLGLSVRDKASVTGKATRHQAYLLPDELYTEQHLSGYKPFFFMQEFTTGLDLSGVVNTLASKLQLSHQQWRRSDKRYFRFRLQSFIESPAPEADDPATAQRRTLVVDRFRAPVQQITRSRVRAAVIRGADYLVRQQRPDGKFRYIYYPLRDMYHSEGYNLPRHAGTAWALSLVYAALGEQRHGRAARLAIEYLAGHAVPPACKGGARACVGSQGYSDLGSAALTLVAIAEYQRASGDRRFVRLAQRIAEFIVWMQRDNGNFCHVYLPDQRRRDCGPVLLYYSGEATLALAKMQQVAPDRRYADAVERAMDYLTGEKYRFFMGQFFISEDHWTCIAAEAASVFKAQYLQFCRELGRMTQRAQIPAGPGPMQDLAGALTVTPFFMPHNTPAASRTEASVATLLLAQRQRVDDPGLLRSIRLAVRYLVDQQMDQERWYLLPNPAAASGAMTRSPIHGDARIDYVQHAVAAMVRALPLIPEQPWPPIDPSATARR